jgi:hypothetical protein
VLSGLVGVTSAVAVFLCLRISTKVKSVVNLRQQTSEITLLPYTSYVAQWACPSLESFKFKSDSHAFSFTLPRHPTLYYYVAYESFIFFPKIQGLAACAWLRPLMTPTVIVNVLYFLGCETRFHLSGTPQQKQKFVELYGPRLTQTTTGRQQKYFQI